MDTAAVSTVVVALAALAPWATLLPLTGAAAVLAHVVTLIAACHGAGLLVARGCRRTVGALLALQWGLAAMVAVSGLALAVRIDGLRTQTVLVLSLAAVHTALVGRRLAAHRARMAGLRSGPGVVTVILLAAIAAFTILGAAGNLGARPFDDDGHVLAQIQRLRDTGYLGDHVGYALDAQLGGQLVLGALATLPGDVHLVRVLEALAFALALGLVVARMRSPAGEGAPFALLVVIAAAALAFAPADPVACWTAVGMILALHATLDDAEPALLPTGLLAGALTSLRLELAPIALAAVLAAGWRHRHDRRALAALVGGALVATLPFIAARSLARLPADVEALLAPPRGPLGLRLVLAGLVVAGGVPAVRALVRDPRHRWLALGAVLALAGIVGELTGERPYALRFLWPLVLAGGLVVLIDLATRHPRGVGALIASLLLIVSIHEGRQATGRVRWTRRYLDLAANLEYVRHVGDHAPIATPYAGLLGAVPAGATIAVWVASPERLDYGGPHAFVDLRTPRASALRVQRFGPHRSRLAHLVAATRADYLLLETDDRHVQRTQASLLYRLACPDRRPGCADDLEALALGRPVIATELGVRVISLTQP